jgi:hypothetical protein
MGGGLQEAKIRGRLAEEYSCHILHGGIQIATV